LRKFRDIHRPSLQIGETRLSKTKEECKMETENKEEERLMTETPKDIDEGARWNDLKARADRDYADREIAEAMMEHNGVVPILPEMGEDPDVPEPVCLIIGTGHDGDHDVPIRFLMYEMYFTPAELKALLTRPADVWFVDNLTAEVSPLGEETQNEGEE